jgi:crossover junction endodeoxyribonuclease RuvC
MLILGVDPGVTGALVLVDVASLQVVDWLDMPIIAAGKTNIVDGAVLGDWLEEHAAPVTLVEHVGGWHPRAHEPGFTGAGAALARLAGGIETMLSALSMPFMHVQASAWKRRAGLLRKDKSASLALARARLSWPKGGLDLAKHHGRAEAALIALYGRAPAAPVKIPKRSKAVDRRAAENVPPGLLFGVEP